MLTTIKLYLCFTVKFTKKSGGGGCLWPGSSAFAMDLLLTIFKEKFKTISTNYLANLKRDIIFTLITKFHFFKQHSINLFTSFCYQANKEKFSCLFGSVRKEFPSSAGKDQEVAIGEVLTVSRNQYESALSVIHIVGYTWRHTDR